MDDPVFQSELYHDAVDVEEKDEPDYFAFGCPACHNFIWIYEDEPQNGIYECKCGAKVKYWQTTEWDSVRDEDVPSMEFALVSSDNNKNALDPKPRGEIESIAFHNV